MSLITLPCRRSRVFLNVSGVGLALLFATVLSMSANSRKKTKLVSISQ